MAWHQRDGSLKGPQGERGLTGPDGAQGVAGRDGARGLQGPAGPTGATGDIGPRGLQGIQGIQGAKGDTGADGRSVLATTGKPASTVGANGDFAYDNASGLMYGPKAGGVWPNGRSLVGPTGATGPRGADGTSGVGTNLPNFPTLAANPQPGRYYAFPQIFTNLGTLPLTIGTIYFMPVLVYRTPSPAYTALTVEVTTAATNGHWRLGMYAMDDSLMPTYVVNDFNGQATTAAANGRKVYPITQSQNDNLTPGPYYVALYAQGTAGGSTRVGTGATNGVPNIALPGSGSYGSITATGQPTAAGTPFPDYPTINGNAQAIRFDFTTA